MSTFEIPVEDKARQKGLRDRHSIYAGQSMPETSPPLAESAPLPLEEMAAAAPPSKTTQVNSEKAPALRTADRLTETDHPQTWSTVPGALATEVSPQSKAAPIQLVAGAGGGGSSSRGTSTSSKTSTPDESWTVAQLQDEASARGLPTSGTKADLIERLTA